MWEIEKEASQKGGLYICATPIGNLEDITIRVLDCLESVDFIAAEDTRHTRKLLSHYNINTPLFSYHRHSRVSKKEIILDRIAKGAKAALVSDAGLPAFHDPGEDLLSEALARQLPVTVLPGASAVLTALLLSGFPTAPFSFLGFLEKKGPKRQKQMEALAAERSTVVFFETPHRLITTLQELQLLLGNRKMAAARELTKKFEEVVRGDAAFLLEHFLNKERLQGEFTMVIAPLGKAEEEEKLAESQVDRLLQAGAEMGLLLAGGLRKKEAATKVADRFNLSKKQLYQLSLLLDREELIPPSS